MSFSADVKKELYAVLPGAKHCAYAELGGILSILRPAADAAGVSICTENEQLSRKIFTLLKKADKIDLSLRRDVQSSGKKTVHSILLPGAAGEKLLKQCANDVPPDRTCCRRAFLRGAFLAGGTMSAPETEYHFEIVCPDEASALRIERCMEALGIGAKSVQRKGSTIVYLKEGDRIVALLGEMGAGLSLMELENMRILRGVRGSVNRRVNCEAANIQKTINTAQRQIRDIEELKALGKLAELPAPLLAMAKIRLQHPEDSLAELGTYFDPPLGKSGVNHRLEKIRKIAAAFREEIKS